MKEILIAVPNDALGGAEQYLKMVAYHYIEQNYFVNIVFLKKKRFLGWEDLEGFSNVKLYYTTANTEKGGLFVFIKNLYSLRKRKFCYIFTSHVHLSGVLGFFIRINILKKKYFICRESTSVFLRFSGINLMLYKLHYLVGYPACDLLICQSHLMKEQLINAMPKLEEKIKIRTIPNPINLNNISAEEEALNFEIYGDYIISAGRLIPEKGFDILLNVFNKVRKAHKNLKLIILGEGIERKKLSDLIIKLKLEDSVFLPGFVQNVYPFFKYAKVCVVSSRIEGFPNVLLQMMSQNNNVVATKCAGGIANINGLFLAETNSIESLEHAINSCLVADTSDNAKLFKQNLEERSIDNFIKRIEKELR